ncbi:uncharacterized protein LOC135472182 [Liolophura sinensis]|uniref:uncharacterized protein LOC135472182 n=1 Tax=Liolophura sinensis TaxID=3198878 RepID=UPI003158B13A
MFCQRHPLGDDFGIEKLPPCWSAVCRVDNNQQTILLATPCSDGFDMEYGQNDQRRLLLDHCYPSNRGELPAPRCCGGYPICAHNGENSDIFNVINFFTFRNQIIYQPWFVKYEDVKLAADGRPPVN